MKKASFTADFNDNLRDAFNEYIKYREQTGAKFTHKSTELLVDDIKHYRTMNTDDEIAELIKESIKNGWKGVFLDKLNKKNNNKGGYNNNGTTWKSTTINGTGDAPEESWTKIMSDAEQRDRDKNI